jgi:hypothetical protein
MHILFAISTLCFFALVLMAIAIARRVHTRRTSTPPQHDFVQHLFAAVEDRNSRVPHPIPQQTVRDILAKKSWNQSSEMITVGPNTQAHQPASSKRF